MRQRLKSSSTNEHEYTRIKAGLRVNGQKTTEILLPRSGIRMTRKQARLQDGIRI